MSRKNKKEKKRPDGQPKLPANARKFPLARNTFVSITQTLQEMQQAAQLYNQKAAEAQKLAQVVADERGLGPIQLHSTKAVDNKFSMIYVPKKGRAVAPDHVRGAKSRRA